MREIVSAKAMKEAEERLFSSGVTAHELMRRAGEALACAYEYHGRVGFVCGIGNNAGDGYAAALCLLTKNIDCEIVQIGENDREPARSFLTQCIEKRIPIRYFHEKKDLSDYDVIVDCIFGIGFHGEAQNEAAEAIDAINQTDAYVISADVPSGLCAENGIAKRAVRCDLCVSIGTEKAGLHLNDAKDVIGNIVNMDVGIPQTAVYRYPEDADVRALFPERKHNSHKGTYKTVGILGGSPRYAGAVKLGALGAAAMRTGAGIVRLIVGEKLLPAACAHTLEETLFPIPDPPYGDEKSLDFTLSEALSGLSSLAVGMGWDGNGDEAKILRILQKSTLPVILDAGALNTAAKYGADLLQGNGIRVITPHPMEFSRLSGVPVGEVLADPIGHAKAFAKATKTVVLLKGTGTVVTDGETVYLTDRGAPGMATAGSGDVLSGILAALLASNCQDPTFTVACGAWIAGRAGEIAEAETNPVSMVASDTASCVTKVISELLK